MKLIRTSLLVLVLISIFSACKNESDAAAANPKSATEKVEKADLPQEEKDRINSVLTKMMVTPELKTFTSATVTGGLTEMLQKQEGPFTVFAPSNKAFQSLPKDSLANFLNPQNKQALITLLKNHIVEGDLNSTDLTKSLRDGEVSLTSLSGEKLTVSKEGTDMILKDAQGNTAVFGKSDILGSNGVVHVIGGVLMGAK